jgi:multidrug efflux pump subunit AcrB
MSDNKSLFPRFALVDWAVRNQITVSVLTVIITISGFLAYRAMPAESFPEVVQPTIFIGTPYPGNSPVDMERLITRPLEKQLNTISGVDKIKSTSVQGFSSIEVRFDFKVGVDEALRKVKDKVDAVQSSADFPKDLPADPNIFELNIAELQPIMNINLSGEFTADQLEDYAKHLEEKIEDISSIASVDLRGVDELRLPLTFKKWRTSTSALTEFQTLLSTRTCRSRAETFWSTATAETFVFWVSLSRCKTLKTSLSSKKRAQLSICEI